MLQIIARYILSDSPVWTEEVARTMMVWTAFLVAPWAYRFSANIRIDLFSNELSYRLQTLLSLSINLLVCWILAVFLNESFGLLERGMTVRTHSLPIQVAWFYSIVPITLALMLLVSFELILRNILSLRYRDEDFSLPAAGEILEDG